LSSKNGIYHDAAKKGGSDRRLKLYKISSWALPLLQVRFGDRSGQEFLPFALAYDLLSSCCL